MFAPKIPADILKLAEYDKTGIAQLRIIAKYPAVTADLWIRPEHGTWRFFLVTPSTLARIDRDGKWFVTGQTMAYLAGVAAQEKGGYPPPLRNLPISRSMSEPFEGPVVPLFPLSPNS